MLLRCLIVDDNLEFLEAARELLERQGVSVVGVASNSAEALERAEQLHPDIALVDVGLGEESGFDLAERLAERSERVEVVLVSTYAEKDLDELIRTSPVAGFLSKRDISRPAIAALIDGR